MTSRVSEDLCTLPHLMRVRLESGPDTVLVSEADGKRSLTWQQLHEDALAWAGILSRLAVGRGDVVITMLPNCVESFVSWLSTAYLGAIESPVNDAYRGVWLSNIVQGAKTAVAIVHEEFLDRWIALVGEVDLQTIVVVGGDFARDETVAGTRVVSLEVIQQERTGGVTPFLGAAQDVASIIWTSGTTGPSKGVLIPWGQWWDRMYRSPSFDPNELGSFDISYRPWPVFHMSGREGLYRNALFGGSTYIRRRFSASEWLSEIREGGCTWTSLIGGTADFILAQPESSADADNPLRFVVCAPVPASVDELRRRFGLERVYTAFGSTETNHPINSNAYQVTSENRLSIGRAVPDHEVKLVNPAGDEVIGAGTGELLLRDERESGRMALGYLGLPEATKERFIDGWFHTGDVLRRDEEGYFYFADRVKDMIRRRGENISSFEVETAVRAHPEVEDCAAFGVPSAIADEEVMVVVVRKPESLITASELHSFLFEAVPRFAVPRFLLFAEDLPRTPSAKVRKTELRDRGVTDQTWDAQSGGKERR